MAKGTQFICTNCDARTPKWSGQCNNCGEWNTLEEIAVTSKSSKKTRVVGSLAIEKVGNVNKKPLKRVSSGFEELDRILGTNRDGQKGFVDGSVLLLSGEPGVGKSSLLINILGNIAQADEEVLYVSGEESVGQVSMRAERIVKSSKLLEKINLANTNDLDLIVDTLESNKYSFVIIDSIQTIQSDQINGVPGGVSQLRYTARKLVELAKSKNVTMVIVGHINKDGDIAGPKILEHLVDVVVQLESEENSDLRIIRSIKNRFGPTNEIGLMVMTEDGLGDVANPNEYLLSDSSANGIVRSNILEGNRVIVVEVQSLISKTVFPFPKRVAEGFSTSRLQIICAVLGRYLKINLLDKDVYVSIGGGIKVTDRSIDLAIALSIISSVKAKILPQDTMVFGELTLSGAITGSSQQSKRLKESKRIGYKKIISSESINHITHLLKLI